MQNSPLPDDLAHPRSDRAHLYGSVGTGLTLLVILAGVVTFWAITRGG